MKFPSDKSFFEFLGTKKGSPVWLILVLAVALLLFGVGGQKEQEASASDETAELCSMISGVGECRVAGCLEYILHRHTSTASAK